MKDWLRNIFKDKKGMGTVEVILIIVVLVGLVIIFKVWFYLFAKTETDNYKIKMLGEHISAGNSMKMKDIHWWCTRHSIKYQMEFEYRKEYPIRANIWNFYSYCRFKLAMSYPNSGRMGPK